MLSVEEGHGAKRLVAKSLASVKHVLHKIDTTGSEPAVVDIALRALMTTIITSKIISKKD